MITAADQKHKEKLMRCATYASACVAFIIALLKAFAWIHTDSLSLLSSFIDSFLDVISSTINWVALYYALQPPDKEHRFGHNKAEDLAALLQAIAIGVSGLFLVGETLHRFLYPSLIENEEFGISIMLISLVLTSFLVMFQRYVVRKTDSPIVKVDSVHYLMDFFMNIAVLFSLGINLYFQLPWIDSLFALGIAVYIFISARPILTKAFNHLMDHECDNDTREKIKNIVLGHPESKGIHDLKTRAAGLKPFIQFHLELDGSMTLYQAHKISDEIELKIRELFPHADIIIHQDPEGVEDAMHINYLK